MGRSEMLTGGRRKTALLGDAMEAVIAAVYLDGGLEAARRLILRAWGERIAAVRAVGRDAKTALQEWAQARGLPPPAYRRPRPARGRTTRRSSRWRRGSRTAARRGRAASKRAAQQAAARRCSAGWRASHEAAAARAGRRRAAPREARARAAREGCSEALRSGCRRDGVQSAGVKAEPPSARSLREP